MALSFFKPDIQNKAVSLINLYSNSCSLSFSFPEIMAVVFYLQECKFAVKHHLRQACFFLPPNIEEVFCLAQRLKKFHLLINSC